MSATRIKPGDVVRAAGGSWWRVLDKEGQQITGRLLVGANGLHHFTSRQVTEVYRQMGRSR